MALPLIAAPEANAAAAFGQQFDHLCRRYRELWLSTEDRTPQVGAKTSRLKQWRNHRAARALIDRLAKDIPRYPESDELRPAWQDELRERVRAFGETHLGWPAGYRQLLFADAFFDTTVLFTREARTFDAELSPAELMQAMRNVWIMNSLQVLLDLEVCFTPAVFGYSMLYPYTDNLLDDPLLAMSEKRTFNQRLGLRLSGDLVDSTNDAERKVFRLVDRIETQFESNAYPEVWCSLRAIHQGQVESLRQQTGTADDLLSISICKGGASSRWLPGGRRARASRSRLLLRVWCVSAAAR